MTLSNTEISRRAAAALERMAKEDAQAALVQPPGCVADAPPTCVISPSSGVPTLPLSADDSGLLDHYFNENECDLSIHQLALRCKRPLAELTAWLNLPHIASIVEAFLNVRRITQVHRDMEKRERALNGLCAVLEFSTNLVETRRAACAVLRAVDNARPRARRSSTSAHSAPSPSTGGGGGRVREAGGGGEDSLPFSSAPSPAPSREMEPRPDCTPSLPRRKGCHEASASRTRDWVGGEDSLHSPRLRSNSSGKPCPILKSIIHKNDKPAVGSIIASDSKASSDRPQRPDTSHLDTSTPSPSVLADRGGGCAGTNPEQQSARSKKRLSSRPCPILQSIIHKNDKPAVGSGIASESKASSDRPRRPDTSHLDTSTPSLSVLADRGGSSRSRAEANHSATLPLRHFATSPASLAAASGSATPRSSLAPASWP